MSDAEKSVENTTKSIIDIRDWSSNNDNTDLNHDLKNHEVDEFISVIIANGVININTFKIT